MQSIQNFAFEEHLVRVVDQDGEPWFVGKDVCAALALANHNQALSRLDDDEKGVTNVDPLGRGGAQEMVIVSEPGVYQLTFSSRKPEAKRFKRWVAHEVLPQIRKTGSYAPQSTPDAMRQTIDIVRDAPLNARVDAIRMARVLFGSDRARQLWKEMGLPAVPPPSDWEGSGETQRLMLLLLDHELGEKWRVRDLILSAYDGSENARLSLLEFGIKVGEEEDGFWLGSSVDGVKKLFREKSLTDGGWLLALRRVPGATPGPRMSFLGRQSRTTWFPLKALDDRAGMAH